MMSLYTMLFVCYQYLYTNLSFKKLFVLNTHNDLDFSLKLQGFDTRYGDDVNNTESMYEIKLNLRKKQLLDLLNNDNIPLCLKLSKISQSKWIFNTNKFQSLIENSGFDLEDFHP